MMNIEDALKLPPGSQEIKNEINERRKLIGEMVGTLYPSILWGEIEKLNQRFTYDPNKKPNYPPPKMGFD